MQRPFFQMHGLRALGWTTLALALASTTLGAQDADVKQLFLANCAQCHGESGDGQGTTKLDRPARSFRDGGFSYGNTPEALFRTLSMGIPGTPMPAFDAALSEAERRALAAYVLTLGPEIREVKEEDTVLVVRDRPLVVRGKLPPIAEGAVEHPRGLLIGTTDGFTFEYQADDVRLLGVRQGDFVRRTDWIGRGGTELEPLGKVVCLVDHGIPGPTFLEGATPRPLLARLRSTGVAGSEPWLLCSLQDGTGLERATVRETLRVQGTSLGAAFVRRFEIHCGTSALELAIALPTPMEKWQPGGRIQVLGSGARRDRIFSMWKSGDSILFGCLTHPEGDLRHVEMAWWRVTLSPGANTWAEVALLPLSAYSNDVASMLAEALGR